jgi:hypothetical protein
LRNPLTERPHQEVRAEVVDAASVVETDDAISSGQQDQDREGTLAGDVLWRATIAFVFGIITRKDG